MAQIRTLIIVMTDKQSPLLTAPVRGMTPIIKVVGERCNLRCKYCFFSQLDQSQKSVMSTEIADRFITEYLDLFSGSVTFNWHGGEPMLAGIAFFEHVVETQKRNLRECHSLRNTIQTNGTLMTDSWADFFRANEFGVGISLDGTPQCHDRFRRDPAGRGSALRALRGIALLRDHGVEPGIIQTVVRSTVGDAEESFRFIVDELGIKHFGVNVFNDWAGANPPMADESLSNQDFVRFFTTYIDLWLERDTPDLTIRNIESLLFGVLGKRGLSCAYNGTCTAFFTVEWDGTVLPACERLSHQGKIAAGNLHNSALVDILNSPHRLAFARSVNTVHQECRDCRWYDACHNGCTAHRRGGVGGRYDYCEVRKELFDYLCEKMASMELAAPDGATPEKEPET